MRPTNATFDTANALNYKTPVYLIHFDGETTDYVNHKVTSPTNTLKQYLVHITGMSDKVTPEEGKASIGSIKATIQDHDDAITTLLATDTYYFHRKKVTVKAGYLGFSEANMLTVMTGWVTGIKMNAGLTAYEFDITDPQRWMQRKVFRGAETSTVRISGNAINIMLRILLSTGDGTNGTYDTYPAVNGLGISESFVDIAGIEQVRDDWFPGASAHMMFTITKREKAKDWIEREILKVLNVYPVIDGQGRFTIKPFKPHIKTTVQIQSFNEDNIIGFPSFDHNLDALINEVEFHYDYTTGGSYDTQEFHFHDSVESTKRGPGKKPLTIKSRGIHSSDPLMIPSDFSMRRANRVFSRFATPPIKIGLKTHFSRWISESGDIPDITHSKLPNTTAGTRGITSKNMEIINRSINWKSGQVSFTMLDTGFAKGRYASISPSITTTCSTGNASIRIPTSNAAKIWSSGWVVNVFDAKMRPKASTAVITATSTSNGRMTFSSDVSASGTVPTSWIITFAKYDNCTTDQQRWAFISSSTNIASSDAPAQPRFLISP